MSLPNLNRRAFLRGAGVLLGLPALDSLMPRAGADEGEKARPRRLAVLYTPNGVNVPQWTVRGESRDYKLSPTLKALEPLKSDFTFFSGLNHEEATPGPDGAGDHSRAAATFLSGCRARKTGGADIRVGVSVDQIAARRIGHLTRFPSLQLSTESQRSAGRCDSGYSCAYQYNIAWKTPTMPLPPEHNPRRVFERLFGGVGIAGDVRNADVRRKLQRSVLDYVRDDARALRRRLASRDRDKLDQYFSAVREIERRIQKASAPDRGGRTAPAGIPESYREHVRVMLDLVAFAFQTDATRIVTFTLAHEGSNRSFPEIGIPEAHHQISHHRGDAEKLKKIARIDRFYVEQFKYFLERMKSIEDGEGSLLDRSMVLYGAGISEGNKHWHSNLPILLAGRGGGSLTPGGHIRTPDPTPMTNLFRALLERLGAPTDRIGDSTGVLKTL